MNVVAFWQPMRRRLPLFITALLAVAIGAFSALAYRQLAKALVAAAGDRTTSVSTRLAAAFAESETRARTDKRRPRADSAFIAFVSRPDARTERDARLMLDRYRESNERIDAAELWSRRGVRLLAATRPGHTAGSVGAAVTGGFASRSVIGPFLAKGDTVYLEVRLPSSPPEAILSPSCGNSSGSTIPDPAPSFAI